MRPQQIPILDARHLCGDPEEQHCFAQQLGTAFHETGFVLIQHHLDHDMCERQLAETRAFFARPLEQKLRIRYEDHSNFRGYMRMGVENTAGETDYREQIEYAVEEPEIAREQREPFYQRLKGRNPWPDDVQPSLRTTTLQYVKAVRQIADGIRRSMCVVLGLDAHHLDSHFEQPEEPAHWVLKLVSYPSAAATNNPPAKSSAAENQGTTMGVGAHIDTNFLTLILQDSVGGLQIWHDGQWTDVPARSDCLVVNLGEQAYLWSRGYFLATPHRVILTTSDQPRISVPLFYNPVLSAVIQPVNDDLPLLQEQRQRTELWRPPNSNFLSSSVGDNTFKSLARSHPIVFAKHHPDLRVLPDGRVAHAEEERSAGEY